MKKTLSILGATGSIGTQTLNVVDHFSDQFDVQYLSTYQNADLLIKQALTFDPQAVAVVDNLAAKKVSSELNGNTEVLTGREGLLELSGRNDVDLVMNGLVGSAGMEPTLCAINAGVNVALSNKESLVMAGSIIESAKKSTQAQIFPVDSEHSAIWQCLSGEDMNDVQKIILTGSGGPFRTRDINTLIDITPEEALDHPNWDMGNKITIDSATMMNKGLEVIETKWLFDMNADQIDIVVHPQSIIHSMVEFKDRSVKAQLGVPDMKVPIQYALTYPRHLHAEWESLDLVKMKELTFESPNLERFPCIQLAYDALKSGNSTSAVLNVANEQAVYRFLKNEIKFTDIPKIIEKACEIHSSVDDPSLNDILELEQWATRFVKEYNV
jgi:1-deoxy-D-xylulose-5-phosphate reductoisomerase